MAASEGFGDALASAFASAFGEGRGSTFGGGGGHNSSWRFRTLANSSLVGRPKAGNNLSRKRRVQKAWNFSESFRRKGNTASSRNKSQGRQAVLTMRAVSASKCFDSLA